MPDPRNRYYTGISTLIGFHDLLGYGDLLAVSGGTLDSAAGEIARLRVEGLSKSLANARPTFPDGTRFFHLNDSAVAFLDVDVSMGAAHTEASAIEGWIADTDVMATMARFVSACAILHGASISREETEKLGPAGRTFVVLGQRWAVAASDVDQVPPLQANVAFAEAYLADQLGSRAGFTHRPSESVYLNDFLWFQLSNSHGRFSPEQQTALDSIGPVDQDFPTNLRAEGEPIEVSIFHRKRRFYSIVAVNACEIGAALDAGDVGTVAR